MKRNSLKSLQSQISKVLAVVLAVSLTAMPVLAEEETDDSSATSAEATAVTEQEIEENTTKPEAGTLNLDEDWVTFFLICNEGMSDRGGNSGNTMMVLSLNQNTGKIRLAEMLWDTFMEYEGYDVPQRIDMAYRNNGPEETVKVFNANMGTDIDLYMSLNFLNLATLIDAYGGVTVDVSRAERNALNGMVASKKENIERSSDVSKLTQLAAETLAEEYYLNEFGEETHLNGLQAVGFGWLQYDSVYNCAERDVEVIGNLFKSLSETLSQEVLFYTDEYDKPESTDGRRVIDLDDMTDDDATFLRTALDPIFSTSYNNLPEEETMKMVLALARTAYLASRQGVDIMDQLDTAVFPLEATEPTVKVAGAEGHVIDFEANAKAMTEFLYAG